MSICFKTEYSNGEDIWKDVKFHAPPGGYKEKPSKELDKKVQDILKRINYRKDS